MVYILLGNGFEEAEALVAADVLRRAELPVCLTGIGGEMVTGAHGIAVKTDKAVEAVTLSAGDMVVLPGGMGGVASIEGSEPAMALVRQAAEPGIWLAAICAAPTLLAAFGLLEGKRAVCYPGMEDEMAGARMEPSVPFVADGRLVTGEAAGSAFPFSLKLVELLRGAETAQQVRTAVHYHG